MSDATANDFASLLQVDGDLPPVHSPVKGKLAAEAGSPDSSTTASPAPSDGMKQLAADGLTVSRQGLLACVICKTQSRRKKMRFCQACARDVAACKKDAEQNGWVEVFEEQSKADDTFVYMILQYQSKCSGRGRGFARDKFDHVTFRESLYQKKLTRRGVKSVMMDWGEFTSHHERKGFSGPEILQKWQDAIASGVETDNNGRKGQELRISTEVETYKLEETEEGTARERELGHSTKKFKAEDVEAMDKDILSKPQNMDINGGGPSFGISSKASMVPGDEAANKRSGKDQKVSPLSRRVTVHDAAVQAVRKLQDTLKKIPGKIKDTEAKFAAEESEFEEYIKIMRARLALCMVLGAADDSKTRAEVETAATSTQKLLEDHLRNLSAEELSYIPDTGKNLKTVPSCLHFASLVLRKNSHEEIDVWKTQWDDCLSALGQMTTLMEQCVKDIEAGSELAPSSVVSPFRPLKVSFSCSFPSASCYCTCDSSSAYSSSCSH